MRQSFPAVVIALSSSVGAFAPRPYPSVSSLAPTKTLDLHATIPVADKDRVKSMSPQIQLKRRTAMLVSANDKNGKDVSSSLIHSANNNSAIDNLLTSTNQFVGKFLSAGGGDDPIGTRGESYFFLQAFLIVSIAFGGIPVLSNYLSLLAGPGLLLAGIAVLFITTMDMGDSITPWPKPNGNGLVQDGLYGIVRHPMYFGLLATMAGFSIATASMERLLLTVLLYFAIEIKSDYEEEELKKAYPGEYEDYLKKVPNKFVPLGLFDLRKKQEQE